MADENSNFKEGIVMFLKCAGKICSAAAPLCPIIGFVDPFTKIILHFLDDGDLEKLKSEFDNLHDALDKIWQKNEEILQEMKRATIEIQFSETDKNIVYQYRKYKEAITAKKFEDFQKSYENSKGAKNMHDLYDAVMGKSLFTNLENSHLKKDVMEKICKRLSYLFSIGFIAMMGYYAVIGDDLQNRCDKWVKLMNEVQEKLQEGLREIPTPAQPMS